MREDHWRTEPRSQSRPIGRLEIAGTMMLALAVRDILAGLIGWLSR